MTRFRPTFDAPAEDLDREPDEDEGWDGDEEDCEDSEHAGEEPLSEAEEEALAKEWWAHLPDFIKPTYPFDLPPERLAFARAVFTKAGAAAHCAEPACRRAGRCEGGDGPPCFRADRENLHRVLFWFWLRIFGNLSEAEYEAALRETGNRYATPAAPAPAPALSRTRRAGTKRRRA